MSPLMPLSKGVRSLLGGSMSQLSWLTARLSSVARRLTAKSIAAPLIRANRFI